MDADNESLIISCVESKGQTGSIDPVMTRPSVPGIRSPICRATRSSSSLASNRVSAVVNRNTSRPRVAMTAMWNACLPSSPAARQHRKSHHSRRTRVMVRMASRDRATVSRCTGGGAGIAAHAAI